MLNVVLQYLLSPQEGSCKSGERLTPDFPVIYDIRDKLVSNWLQADHLFIKRHVLVYIVSLTLRTNYEPFQEKLSNCFLFEPG